MTWVALAALVACPLAVIAGFEELAAVGKVVDKDRDPPSRHQDYRRRSDRHVHRNLVLYSHN